jgi:microsomal dipeptidase-like Zn-dependent dipeptidase
MKNRKRAMWRHHLKRLRLVRKVAYTFEHIMPMADPRLLEGAALMAERVKRVFALAAAEGHRHLVLGAWGCGAFSNDPEAVQTLFEKGVLTINDWSPGRCFLGPFARRFSV